MRKYKSKYLKPYIRKAKSSDYSAKKAMDFKTCIRQATLETRKEALGKDAYVLVQHGANEVLSIAGSKEEIKECLVYLQVKFGGKHKNKAFNEWCNMQKHRCQK